MISVVMPTYNSAAGLARSIASILQQTFTEFELLVIDDGSTDDTAAVIASFTDQRIRYIRMPHRGISASLNTGLAEARFDIIARMDAGDISVPDRFQKQYDRLNHSIRSAIVSCHYAMFRDGVIQYLVKGSSDPSEIQKRLILHPDIPHPGTMYHKQLVTEAGGYRNVPLEDYDLWLRLKDTVEFLVVPEPLILVEHLRSSLTNSDVRKRYADHYRLQEAYYRDLGSSFGITNEQEQYLWKGWREYFYGDPTLARRWWMKSGDRSFRIMTAMIISLFPSPVFVRFKEKRIRQRIEYLLHYRSTEAVRSRKYLRMYFQRRSVL